MLKQFQRRRRPGRFRGQPYPSHPATGIAIAGVIAPTGLSTEIDVVWSTELSPPPAAIPPGWLIDGQTPSGITEQAQTLWRLSFSSAIATGAPYSLPATSTVTNLAGQQWAGGTGAVL